MIKAIIDIGSNTVRMAIYEINDNKPELLFKKKDMLGLASFLENNRMTSDGIEKLCHILNDYKEFLSIFSIEDMVAFATAALRNCHNSLETLKEIESKTGIEIKILSGEKEAEYDFIGATQNNKMKDGLIVDIGGGSTELIYFLNKSIKKKISIPIGSLLLKKSCCNRVIPNKEDVKKMYEIAQKNISEIEGFSNIKSELICGIGGTFKGTTMLYNALYGKERHNKSINTENIKDMIKRFGSDGKLIQSEAVILMKNIPDRINTIISGMVIIDVIARKFNSKKIIYSDSGVREGFIYSEIIKNNLQDNSF